MAQADSRQQWTADFKAYLEFMRDEERISTVTLRPETLAALRRRKAAPVKSAVTGGTPAASTAPRRVAAPPAARAAGPAGSAGRPVAVPPPDLQADPATELARVAQRIAACQACGLHATRTKTVPGQGHPRPEVMFVGEAPGADEDQQGLAFVGRAGQLLTKMIAAMGFSREEVFIANINKCRPPNNRPPMPEEMETCLPYLKAQIAILRPRVIVALGATAVRGLLKTDQPISQLRGTWQEFEGIPVMPTFHPAYLLRDPHKKRPAWEDLQAVLKKLGRPVPAAPRGE